MSAGLSDFNDLAATEGLEVVREQLQAAVPAKPAKPAKAARPATAAPPAPKPEEWPEPMLPGAGQVPDIPPDVLPGWVGAMVRAVSASTQTPPALAVMCALSVLATVLQRRFEVSPYGTDYVEPLSLWTLSASPSGTRKTGVLKALRGPLVHWEKLMADRLRKEVVRVNSARAVAKKRIERLLQDAAKAEDPKAREAIRQEIEQEEANTPAELRAPRLFTGEVTPERLQALLVEQGERMAVLSDEPGIFLIMAGIYSGGAAAIDVFLQGHAGSPLRIDRAGREAHVDRPALSFGLMIQPGVMSDVASSRRFRDSGLLARFLYALPVSNVGRRDVRQQLGIPPEVAAEYERRLFALLEGATDPASAPRVLTMSAEAQESWLELAEAIEHRQGEGGNLESISDWTSKLPGAVARVAALFELAESGLEAAEIGEQAMRNAVWLGWLLVDHARAAFAILGTDAVDVDAAHVLRWAQAHELAEFKRSECQKAMEGRFRSVDRLVKALERLEAMDVVRGFKRLNKGGPPSHCYRVNPRCLSA